MIVLACRFNVCSCFQGRLLFPAILPLLIFFAHGYETIAKHQNIRKIMKHSLHIFDFVFFFYLFAEMEFKASNWMEVFF
jgi:hypothetical protein